MEEKKIFQVDVVIETRFPIAVIAEDAMSARELAYDAYLREASSGPVANVWDGQTTRPTIVPVCTMSDYGKRMWEKYDKPIYSRNENGDPRPVRLHDLEEAEEVSG